MTTLVTQKFKAHSGRQFIESITESSNNVYYLVAAKHTPYANGDTLVGSNDSYQESQLDIFSEAIFGKKITSSDVSLMIPKYTWTANTVYTPYDHTDGNIFSKQFYVVVDGGSTYYVYKCLDNNSNTASNSQPTDTSESACNFVTTSDGYMWKLMYKMDESTFEKFSTSDYMPVVTSANVAGNTVAGAIDVIKVTYPGSNYISAFNGQFNIDDLRASIPTVSGNSTTYRLASNASSSQGFYVGSALYISSGTGAGQIKKITSYNSTFRVAVIDTEFAIAPSSDSTYTIAPYVTINGDGNEAEGYAVVASNASVNNYISKINLVYRGNNYTFAQASITGNTGGVSNSAVLKVIIPPYGGHGFDSADELGSSRVGISVAFNTSESGFITLENDYRKIAVLKDPKFNRVSLTLDTENGTFINGETIYQVDYKNLIGVVTSNTSCTVITGTSTTFNKSLKVNDHILITDISTGASSLRTITGITNATSLNVNQATNFESSFASISYVDINTSGKKIGNSSPYIDMSNVEPKFVTGKLVVGETSGATANVTGISVNEKNYNNWLTFDGRTRLSYSSNTGTMVEDEFVFVQSLSTANARFHSSNNTYVFVTEEKGNLLSAFEDGGITLIGSNSSSSFTLSGIRYEPDVIKGAGRVLFVENNNAISRSAGQSETVRLIINY